MLRAFFAAVALLSAHAIGAPLAELAWQDPALKSCVMKSATKQGWQQTQQVTAIKCHGKGIQVAADLKHFSELEQLSLYNNRLAQADLRHLFKLKSLNLANNRLQTLLISGLAQLETLYLFKNQLQTVDLTGLSAVTKVRLMQNQLTQLDIRPLKSLQQGYFFDNQLEDLAIEGLDKLTFLDVKQNPMPDELYDFYDEQEGIVISHDGNADDWQ